MVEEIRVRYEGERRKRDRALFDAYDDQGGEATSQSSQVVERMLLGDAGLIPGSLSPAAARRATTEEINFDSSEYDSQITKVDTAVPGAGSEDFVMFHDVYAAGTSKGLDDLLRGSSGQTKMGWDQYKGLGSALEDCAFLVKSSTDDGRALSPRRPN